MASESKGRRGIESDDSVPFYKEALFLWKAYALRIVRTAGVEPFDMESSPSLFQWMAFGFWYHTLPVMPVVLETSLIRISEGCQDDDEVVWALTEFTGRIFGFTQFVTIFPFYPLKLTYFEDVSYRIRMFLRIMERRLPRYS